MVPSAEENEPQPTFDSPAQEQLPGFGKMMKSRL
jgi:hypothetical protein